MSILNLFLFSLGVIFALIGWKSATIYFNIGDNKMAWAALFFSAFNAASAASMIL